MTDHLAETPERFDPQTMGGRLIEAEHLARYAWAAPLAATGRVLDAGCGTAYGTEILARAGATEVVGIDVDQATVEAARPRMPANARLDQGDVRALPFPDGEFDAVVCFEVIEHVEDPESVLDELARVLGATGLLVVSSPNRDVYPAGNPHHRHELVPDELEAALAKRFTNVRLARQHDWLASAVLDDGVASGDLAAGFEATVRSAAIEPGAELYTLALASNAELPDATPSVVLTETADAKWWQEQLDTVSGERDSLERALREAQTKLGVKDSALEPSPDQPVSFGSDPTFPPFELAQRVGSLVDAEDPERLYDEIGTRARDSIVALLPDGWSFEGKRVLDFGCGAGRVLRHFLDEAAESEFWGCDIDAPSIAWLGETVSPPFKVFTNGPLPPLALESGTFDLVYAVSVFSHLTDSWSRWLLELHRILAPEGLLVASFIGPGAASEIIAEPWDEERIGMNVLRPGQSWELGGPMVVHSRWWIEAHWGRAFDVLALEPDGFGAPSPAGQGVALLRKRDVALDPAELERPEPDEPRELSAARANLEQLGAELGELRPELEQTTAALRAEGAKRKAAETHADELEATLAGIARSRSWRLTAPLRSLGRSRPRGEA